MLTASGYNPQSTAGDSLRFSNGKKFSAPDQDNDPAILYDCSKVCQGAFWYEYCCEANPLG